MIDLDLRALHAGLTRLEDFRALAFEDLVKLPERGLAHDHVLLGKSSGDGDGDGGGDGGGGGAALLARVPRLPRPGLSPEEALALQAECFRRAAAGGHTPVLHACLAPDPHLPLPYGALIVEAVEGRAVRLPDDLPRMAEALASVHRLPVPEQAAPLIRVTRPVRELAALIARQAAFVPALVTDAESRALLDEELDWARRFAASHGETPLPPVLVLTDTHPGNYVVRPDGRAIFVDMEKTCYGNPAIDLAHATLYSSLTWDPDVPGLAGRGDVIAFHERYMAAIPPQLADSLRPWMLPFRRLTWLRTVTWGCRWYAENSPLVAPGAGRAEAGEGAGAGGAAGAAEGRRMQMLKGVLERLRRMTRRETIERVRRDWHGPDRLFAEWDPVRERQ